MKTVILFSGGMDSTVLLAQARSEERDIQTLFFGYGARHSTREFQAAQLLAARYGVPFQYCSLEFIHAQFRSALLKRAACCGDAPAGEPEGLVGAPTVVPGRNLIMVSMAAGWAESHGGGEVLIGCNRTDREFYPDCRAEFLRATGRTLALSSGGRVSLRAPLIRLDKRGIVRLGNRLRVPWELTWSCYDGGQSPCGLCGACLVRAEALAG